MKIALTGGGTGGHFYPLIAVAQEVNQIVRDEKLAIRLYYFSTEPYDEEVLYEQQIQFIKVPSGKLRIYPSIKNITDMFKVVRGIFTALWKLFRIYPDVVFAKGGYASFPTLVAAKLLNIPIITHASDVAPGRVDLIASRWAKKIAVSYEKAAHYFPEKVQNKIAHTGQPIRRELRNPITDGAYQYLYLEPGLPTIVLFGGSQGAVALNDTLWSIVPDIINDFQIIHQVGKRNIDEMEKMAQSELAGHPHQSRYKPVAFLNALGSSMAAGVATVIISRAGSQLFEFARWEVPSIIIPRTHSVNDHNRKNAYTYAESGACVVIEEKNLSPSILESEIRRISENQDIQTKMKEGARAFAQQDAAYVIARALVDIALSHES